MVAQAAQSALISPIAYLRREAQAKRRHEYVAGVVCEMAGASRNHVEIQAALATEIGSALKGKPCRLLGQDTKVWIESTNSYYYPDATVSCPPNFVDSANGVIDNPRIIIEVLSSSTRSIDRGPKFAAYRTLASLNDYVLIDSESRKVEVFTLERNEWMVRVYDSTSAHFPSIDINLSLDELYRHVVLST